MARVSLITVIGAALLLSACHQTNNWGGGETVGTLGGAAAGGLVGNAAFGHSAAGTLAGVLVGGAAGNVVGGYIDDQDRQRASAAQQRAYLAPTGQQLTWNNPQSNNSGTITPVRDSYSTAGAYCREFNQTININGQLQQAYGTACQQPDGSWKIVQ